MKKYIRLLVENLFDDIYDLNNDVNDVIELGNNLQLYNYYPKSFNELRNIIEQLLKERGKDADLNDIDVSKITTFYNEKKMLGLFENLDPHNIDISQWNVSNVIDMYWTFYMCENFNCDLSNWNVSNVKNMRCMFNCCKKFTGQGLENWNVSNVKDMQSMFNRCENFNCNLENWNVSKVEYMYGMFDGCKKFTGQGLENWKISDAKLIYNMFYGCEKFDCDLSNWNVSNVRDMDNMFDGCISLKNIPSWYKKNK